MLTHVGSSFHCGSFSKSLCPGYRLGWVVNKRFNETIQKVHHETGSLAGRVPLGVERASAVDPDRYDAGRNAFQGTGPFRFLGVGAESKNKDAKPGET